MSFDRHGDAMTAAEEEEEIARLSRQHALAAEDRIAEDAAAELARRAETACRICGKELVTTGVDSHLGCPIHGSRGVPKDG